LPDIDFTPLTPRLSVAAAHAVAAAAATRRCRRLCPPPLRDIFEPTPADRPAGFATPLILIDADAAAISLFASPFHVQILLTPPVFFAAFAPLSLLMPLRRLLLLPPRRFSFRGHEDALRYDAAFSYAVCHACASSVSPLPLIFIFAFLLFAISLYYCRFSFFSLPPARRYAIFRCYAFFTPPRFSHADYAIARFLSFQIDYGAYRPPWRFYAVFLPPGCRHLSRRVCAAAPAPRC
jgi:hypothetical protein